MDDAPGTSAGRLVRHEPPPEEPRIAVRPHLRPTRRDGVGPANTASPPTRNSRAGEQWRPVSDGAGHHAHPGERDTGKEEAQVRSGHGPGPWPGSRAAPRAAAGPRPPSRPGAGGAHRRHRPHVHHPSPIPGGAAGRRSRRPRAPSTRRADPRSGPRRTACSMRSTPPSTSSAGVGEVDSPARRQARRTRGARRRPARPRGTGKRRRQHRAEGQRSRGTPGVHRCRTTASTGRRTRSVISRRDRGAGRGRGTASTRRPADLLAEAARTPPSGAGRRRGQRRGPTGAVARASMKAPGYLRSPLRFSRRRRRSGAFSGNIWSWKACS